MRAGRVHWSTGVSRRNNTTFGVCSVWNMRPLPIFLAIAPDVPMRAHPSNRNPLPRPRAAVLHVVLVLAKATPAAHLLLAP